MSVTSLSSNTTRALEKRCGNLHLNRSAVSTISSVSACSAQSSLSSFDLGSNLLRILVVSVARNFLRGLLLLLALLLLLVRRERRHSNECSGGCNSCSTTPSLANFPFSMGTTLEKRAVSYCETQLESVRGGTYSLPSSDSQRTFRESDPARSSSSSFQSGIPSLP